MPAKQQNKATTERATDEHVQLNAQIGSHVIQALGRPGDLFSVQVRRLWEEHFRVNILVGVDAASTRIAHSYFLVADTSGLVRSTTPPIKRQY